MSDTHSLTLTLIGGPTALIEFAGLRYLTDPTFDPAGSVFEPNPDYRLVKTAGPAREAEEITPIDAILLSHDHHFDNLDSSGRAFLGQAKTTLTTVDGAGRLGGNARGLANWESVELVGPDGGSVHLTGTPCRHGPEGGDRGPVAGFVLTSSASDEVVYVSGDTVWYHGVEEVAERFGVTVAVLFMGAARVKVAGPGHLTFTAEEGVLAARLLANAKIVPIHRDSWLHFTESQADIERVFEAAGLADRLVCLEPGVTTTV